MGDESARYPALDDLGQRLSFTDRGGTGVDHRPERRVSYPADDRSGLAQGIDIICARRRERLEAVDEPGFPSTLRRPRQHFRRALLRFGAIILSRDLPLRRRTVNEHAPVELGTEIDEA